MMVGGITTTGPREANEDNLYYLDFSQVTTFTSGIQAFVMVSDGMGGYQGGDVASSLVVASAESYLQQLLEMARDNLVDLDPAAALVEIVTNAHDAICAESSSRGNAAMGATFVAAFVSPTHAWIAHVGDSRAYKVTASAATQLTEDHSHVGRLLSRGVITEEQAQSHPDRNKIERALGFPDATPDVGEVDLEDGDALLLCSDGVYTVLDAPTLHHCVTQARDAKTAADRIVRLALSGGTDDNATAVVLMLRDAPRKRRRGSSSGTIPSHAPVRQKQRQGTQQVKPVNPAPQEPFRGGGRREVAPHLQGVVILLAGILIGALIVILIMSTVPSGGGQTAAPSEPAGTTETGGVAASAQTDAPATETVTTPEPAPNTEVAPSSKTRQVQIRMDAMAELKYVDRSGLAQLFSYDTFGISETPQLVGGRYVTVEEGSKSYNRLDKSYLTLTDSYREELLGDLKAYAQGTRLFSSSLSRLFDVAVYESFLAELSIVGADTVDAGVSYLIIDAPSTEVEGAFADATAEGDETGIDARVGYTNEGSEATGRVSSDSPNAMTETSAAAGNELRDDGQTRDVGDGVWTSRTSSVNEG